MKRMTQQHQLAVAGAILAAAMSFGGSVHAQEEEIDAPAGDLPEDGEATAEGDAAAEDTAAGDGAPPAMMDTDPADAAKMGKFAGEGEETTEGAAATWESYGDPTGGATVAEEITGGVRVEDIVEPPADYRYAAFGKPDPFVPPMITEDHSVDGLEIPIVSPLQRFQLTSLDLVGVWQLSSGERKAMVMTPEGGEGGGQGIIVKNGDPIANRGGKILSIGDDYLTVREFSLAPDGTRQFEDRQLFMGKRTDESGKLLFTPGLKETVTLEDTSGRVIYTGQEPDGGGNARAAEAVGLAFPGDLPAAAGGAGATPNNGAAPAGAPVAVPLPPAVPGVVPEPLPPAAAPAAPANAAAPLNGAEPGLVPVAGPQNLP